jgi:hypothetical protein
MKSLSTLALAAALTAGLGTVAATQPAFAAKKEEAKPGMKLSPEFVKVAKPAQDALNAKNFAAAEPLVAQAEATAKSDDEKYVAAQFRLTLVSGTLTAAQDAGGGRAAANETALIPPLDTLIASPVVPPADKARYQYLRGSLTFNSRQPAQALPFLLAAQQAGYVDARDPGNLDLMIAQAKMDSGDLAGGTAAFDQVIAKAQASGKPAPETYYKYIISRANRAKDKPLTITWLNRYVKAYPTPQTWHDVLVTYGLSSPSVDVLDKGQRIDLYRLLHDTKGLSDQSLYEEYAQDLVDRGLPTEAEAVLKEGQASGKLTAGKALTDALRQASTQARAEGSLAPLEAKARNAADGKLAAQTADGYLSQGNNAKAADLYKVALTKGGVNADDVNTHLGIALSRSGDKAGAAAAFGNVKTGVRGDLATFWSTWVASQG